MADFPTIPTDLVYVAQSTLTHFEGIGHVCAIEPKELEYPERPAFVAEIHGESTIVVVGSHLDRKRINKWVSCAKCMTAPTKVVLAIPSNGVNGEIDYAAQNGAGVVSVRDDLSVTSLFEGRDQTFHIALPDLTDETAALKRKLAPSYQKFQNGDWRDAFEEACISLEQEAREYFATHVQSGRIITHTPTGKVNTPTVVKIQEMTIGALYAKFSKIVSINSTDQLVVDTLKKINPPRIKVAHKRRQNDAELRPLIGSNMHAIVNCLRAML